jgi:hypothetical protein
MPAEKGLFIQRLVGWKQIKWIWIEKIDSVSRPGGFGAKIKAPPKNAGAQRSGST